METFLFWWSIVSTILGVVFLVANVGQLVAYIKEKGLTLKEKEIHKSQVKVWQQHAFGIQRGLFVVTLGKFSTVEDIRESVKAMQQDADSLYKSLNEERLFSDEEIKERQIQNEKDIQETLRKTSEQNRGVSTSSSSSAPRG